MESMTQVDTIRDSDVHERSELLPKVRAERKRTPLPKVQFGVLMLGQLAEPISATCILPFLNQMISEFDITGKDPAKVGYYVGLMVSLFFLTEAMIVLHWSRLSDRIGRKPVLCIGLAGITVSMLFVGLSRSFWVLVLSRMLCGALNGNTGVAKSATGELTDSTNVAQAFALMPITWAAGVTVAPLMGGLLQRPAERFPQYFDTPFWRVYPYFLPCLAAALFSFVCLVVTFFLFEETLAKHNSEEDDSQSATPTSSGMSTPTEPVGNMILQNTVGGNPLGAASLLQGEPAMYPHPTSSIVTDKLSGKNAPLPLRQLLASPGVAVSIANYGLLAILDIAYGALLPLFLASPVLLGGLGLDPPKIGVVMGTWGLLNGLFQAMCFTRVLGRLGPRRTFVMGISCFVPIFAFFGIENAAARIIKFSDHAGVPGAWIVWTLIAVQMMLVMVMDFSFGTIFIYIRAASPSKRSLGATNGLAQLLASIVRAIGPACATSMYAFSVDHDLLGGYAVYVVLIAVTTISLKLALALPREIAEDD